MNKKVIKLANEVANLKKIDNHLDTCISLLNEVKNNILSFCMNFAQAYDIDPRYTMKRFLSVPEFNCFSKWFFLNVIYKIGIRVYPQNMFWLREGTAKKLISYIPDEELQLVMKGNSSFKVYNKVKDIVEDVRIVNLCDRHINMLINPLDCKIRSISEQKVYAKSLPSVEVSRYLIVNGGAQIGNNHFTRDELIKIIREIDSLSISK